MKYLNRKIRCLLAMLTILFLAGIVDAIPSEQWNKTFGGSGWDSANLSGLPTSDGGYILAGATSSYGAGGTDVWLIKTDASGNQQWNKTFGGSNSDHAYSVQPTSDGGYILAGMTNSYGAGNGDVWLIKTDASGNQQWNRTFGGSNWDYAYSVQPTSDGGYVLAGKTSSYGAGGTDVWLIKTDASGNQQWNKTFGASGWDSAYLVQPTSDGGYVLAGETYSYGAGLYDAWLIKIDAGGNQQWNRTFGGSNSDYAYSVQHTSDGGYVLTGKTSSYGAGGDAWLIKTDAGGNQQLNRTFGGSNSDSGNSVQPTSDGGYILVGMTNSYGAGGTDVWLIKTDASGNQQWNKTFGGTGYDYGGSVMQTSDGGYILTVGSNGDVWLIKLSGEGASSSIGYSATVATGQNTFVQSSNGTFGLLLKGQTKTINNSVILNNTGDISARVEARFNDSISGVFGLISGANVLNATNFALGIPSSLVPLNNSGADVQVAVAPPGVTALDARLGVPNEQAAGDYSGTVIMTFSNNI